MGVATLSEPAGCHRDVDGVHGEGDEHCQDGDRRQRHVFLIYHCGSRKSIILEHFFISRLEFYKEITIRTIFWGQIVNRPSLWTTGDFRIELY